MYPIVRKGRKNKRPRVTIRAMEGAIFATELALRADSAALGSSYPEKRERRLQLWRARKWAQAMRAYLVSRQRKGAEPLFHVFNETDGVYASDREMTSTEAMRFMKDFRRRFERQGYYRTAAGERLPVSQLALVLRRV